MGDAAVFALLVGIIAAMTVVAAILVDQL